MIGKQGTNLQRISDETGIRVTRGRPKNDGLDPTDRDFLFFNDNNAPMEKVEEALRQLLIIGRRKLHDWLPEEGKAAEVAKKLADEGKLVDSGPPPPSSGGNGVYGGSGSYSSNGGTAAGYGAANFSGQQQGFANGNYEFQKQMSQRQEGDYQANGNHSSPVQNGFPAQASFRRRLRTMTSCGDVCLLLTTPMCFLFDGILSNRLALSETHLRLLLRPGRAYLHLLSIPGHDQPFLAFLARLETVISQLTMMDRP